ncbi:hypothetical protein C8F04DRAFT_1184477 [Mycena alexandri]|uniref:Uncharacterized protein n=1 Tax=Mycena alexandri TaxID=1745969 RepID=A0AAD6SWE1_9AGAR|nr:hypothetical protein C8F04DRAFT_1184477 [Mycena alexandri]
MCGTKLYHGGQNSEVNSKLSCGPEISWVGKDFEVTPGLRASSRVREAENREEGMAVESNALQKLEIEADMSRIECRSKSKWAAWCNGNQRFWSLGKPEIAGTRRGREFNPGQSRLVGGFYIPAFGFRGSMFPCHLRTNGANPLLVAEGHNKRTSKVGVEGGRTAVKNWSVGGGCGRIDAGSAEECAKVESEKRKWVKIGD